MAAAQNATLDERATLIALLRREDVSWTQLARDVFVSKSAAAWADQRGLRQGELFDDSWQPQVECARQDLAAWEKDGIAISTVVDPNFPTWVMDATAPPPVLFWKGNWPVTGPEGVAVVGSREATAESREAAIHLAQGLVRRGVTVVSGLAKGIDTAALQSAIDSGGRTVAVIGTGISRSYPEENRALQERISREHLLISQFWPEAKATQATFPQRNDLMAAWSRATVVVQASERSGARIQVRVALKQGREVYFWEGMSSQSWAVELVQQGRARFISDAVEIG